MLESHGLCGRDEHGGDKRDMLLYEAAKKGWKESRNTILVLLYYLLCTHIAKRVHNEGLADIGLDHDLIFTAAQTCLEEAMDKKKGRKNGPFHSFSDKKSIVQSCSKYVVISTQSAVRNLRRKMGKTYPLQGDEAVETRVDCVEDDPQLQLIELSIQNLTPRQQQVIPLIRGLIKQSDLAKEMGVTTQRVNALRKSAIKQLRQELNLEVALDE